MARLKNEYGHYVVAGRRYNNKLKAVIDAVPNGWWPHWNFYEDQFSKINWSIEPTESLEDLYCRRARSLRQQYEHISIEFSGGADSWNALYSFLRAGCHVDAVIHRYLDVGLTDISDLSATNQYSEGRFQAYPWFKRFQELDPNLKWYTYYLTDNLINAWAQTPLDVFELNANQVVNILKVPGDGMIAYDCIPPFKTSALVYGLDKPNLFFKNNNFYLFFADEPVHGRGLVERTEIGVPHTDIMFYWDPDCTDLLIKQAHIVMNWFKKHPQYLTLINNRKQRNRDLYYNIVNALVYPEYKPDWQSTKVTGKTFLDSEIWFHCGNPENLAVRNWKNRINDYSGLVHDTLHETQFETFLEAEQHNGNDYYNLPNSWSHLYKIGSL